MPGSRSRRPTGCALGLEAALRAIETTARHLGLVLAGDDADLPMLADRMMRLMLEISEERERRARGHFAEPQPFLGMALKELGAAHENRPAEVAPATPALRQAMAAPPPAGDRSPVVTSRRAEATVAAPGFAPPAAGGRPDAGPDGTPDAAAAGAPALPAPVPFEDPVNVVRFAPARPGPWGDAETAESTLIEIFDAWFCSCRM